jgi:hypothetical protein
MLGRSETNFFDRAGIAEIDCYVAIFHRWVDRVAEVALRDDVDLRNILRKIGNRPAHSAARTNQRHAHRFVHFAFSNS